MPRSRLGFPFDRNDGNPTRERGLGKMPRLRFGFPFDRHVSMFMLYFADAEARIAALGHAEAASV
jgi:hypothetical protein